MSDSFVTPWPAAHQASLSMGFPRQEHWSGLPCPLPGDLPDAGIDPCLLCLLHWQADSLPLHHLGHQRAVLNVHREVWPGCRQSQQQGLEDGWGAPLPASPQLPGVCFAVAAGAWKPGGLGSGLLINGRSRQVQSCGHCPGLRQPLGSVGLLGPWSPLFSWLCPHQARSLEKSLQGPVGTLRRRETAGYLYYPGGGKIAFPDGRLGRTTVHVPALSPLYRSERQVQRGCRVHMWVI